MSMLPWHLHCLLWFYNSQISGWIFFHPENDVFSTVKAATVECSSVFPQKNANRRHLSVSPWRSENKDFFLSTQHFGPIFTKEKRNLSFLPVTVHFSLRHTAVWAGTRCFSTGDLLLWCQAAAFLSSRLDTRLTNRWRQHAPRTGGWMFGRGRLSLHVGRKGGRKQREE